MIIEIELGGTLQQMNVQSVKVILPAWRYQRHVAVTEEGIIIDIVDDDGEVIEGRSIEHNALLDVNEDAPDQDR